MKLEVGNEVLHSRCPAKGKNQAVVAPAKDGSDLMFFVVEVSLVVFTTKAAQHHGHFEFDVDDIWDPCRVLCPFASVETILIRGVCFEILYYRHKREHKNFNFH